MRFSALKPSDVIIPAWQAPDNVKALISTRNGGISVGPYESFNLGDHVEDDFEKVEENRQRLYDTIGHPVQWLKQVHGIQVAELNNQALSHGSADAVFSREANQVCAVLTADCLPVLLCSQKGDEVAAVHCGWRSLLGGVLLNTLQCFNAGPEYISAYLGPAISQKYFEVGEDVFDAFLAEQAKGRFAGRVEQCFIPHNTLKQKYMADLYALARAELQASGVTRIAGGNYCTFGESRFYSYRRDGITGRMASMIWFDAD